MKTKLALMTLTLAALTACSSTAPQSAPTALDQKFFDTTTNYVTNTVMVTDTVPVVVTVTDTVAGQSVIVPVTNYIQEPVPVNTVTTDYVYTPNAASQALASTAGVVASATGTPWAGLIGAGLSGILAIVAAIKSRQATTAQTIAVNSAQIIEVARNIIASLPNGAAVSAQFDAWLQTHQQDANIANEVAALVDNYVNPTDSGQATVAQGILAAALAPLPVANQTTTAAVPVVKV